MSTLMLILSLDKVKGITLIGELWYITFASYSPLNPVMLKNVFAARLTLTLVLHSR